MANKLSKEEEKNIHGFTGDAKDFMRKGDFESALVLIGDLKKYIQQIKKKRRKNPND